MAVIRGERPPQSPGQSATGEPYEWLWALAEKCWTAAANHRPTALEVVRHFPNHHTVRRTWSCVTVPRLILCPQDVGLSTGTSAGTRPLIGPDEISFETPDLPFNTSGGYGDLFVGRHNRIGKVAVKRLPLSPATAQGDDARVSPSSHLLGHLEQILNPFLAL